MRRRTATVLAAMVLAITLGQPADARRLRLPKLRLHLGGHADAATAPAPGMPGGQLAELDSGETVDLVYDLPDDDRFALDNENYDIGYLSLPAIAPGAGRYVLYTDAGTVPYDAKARDQIVYQLGGDPALAYQALLDRAALAPAVRPTAAARAPVAVAGPGNHGGLWLSGVALLGLLGGSAWVWRQQIVREPLPEADADNEVDSAAAIARRAKLVRSAA